MKLTILGSGSAIIREDRAAPSFLLESNGKLMLFDCGWGTPFRLAQLKVNEQDLDHIFISHRHADHMATLESILQSMHVRGVYPPGIKREKPFYLHGYLGFKADYQTIKELFFPDVVESHPVEISEYKGESREIAGLKISTLPVKHVKYFANVAFKVETGGKTFFYSGDCGYDDKISEFASGSDIALVEMCIPPSIYNEHGPRSNHLSPIECGMVARGAKKLVLWHLYDNIKERDATEEIRKNFQGEIIFAKDLMEITA